MMASLMELVYYKDGSLYLEMPHMGVTIRCFEALKIRHNTKLSSSSATFQSVGLPWDDGPGPAFSALTLG